MKKHYLINWKEADEETYRKHKCSKDAVCYYFIDDMGKAVNKVPKLRADEIPLCVAYIVRKGDKVTVILSEISLNDKKTLADFKSEADKKGAFCFNVYYLDTSLVAYIKYGEEWKMWKKDTWWK